MNDLACYILFQAANEAVAEMQTQQGTIPRAPNIALSKRGAFFHHGRGDVLFIKARHSKEIWDEE